MFLSVLATPDAQAQTLADLVAATPSGTALVLPPGTTSGRSDIAGDLVITGAEDSRLTAPGDDAILIVTPGAQLALSQVTLAQDGATLYALYVDGGSLDLSDCRIEGAFEVAIYVASGQLSLHNCEIEGSTFGIQAAPGALVTLDGIRMAGQGDTAIRADGAQLMLRDVTIADTGQNGVVAVGAPELVADGLTVTGSAQLGVWVEGTAKTTLSRLIIQVAGQALSLIGGETARLDGFHLQGTTASFQAEAISGSLSLSRGRLLSGEGATTAYLRDIAGLTIRDLQVIGGETGLYLTGSVPQATVTGLVLQSQSGTGLFLDGTESAAPPVFTDLRIIAAGSALAAYFRDSGPVTLTRAALISAGTLTFGTEGQSSPGFHDSLLIGAPEAPERHLALVLDPEQPPVFLPDGPLWWAEDPAIQPGSHALTVATFAEAVPPIEGLQSSALAFGLGQEFRTEDLLLALDYALPAAATATATKMIEVGLAPPEPGWLWDPAAIRITLTGPDGLPVSASPGDFPLSLPPGDYALALDDRPAGRVSLAAGAALELPLPDAPFYAWRDEQGQKWRGPALYLRPKPELAALLAGFRPLRPGEYWGYAPQFAARPGADRTLAASFISSFRDRLPKALDELASLKAAESWPAFNRRWLEVDFSLDILAGFGSREDAAWLLALSLPQGVQIDQIETAVLIEMRLGALADGAALAAARQGMASALPTDADQRHTLIRLVRSLARSGLPEGTALLARLALSLDSDDPTLAPNATGIVELSRLDPTGASGQPSRYLDRFEAHLQAFVNGDLPPDAQRPTFLDLWTAAVSALAHEAAHAPPGSTTRRLPIPPDAGIGAMAWAFDDPTTLMLGPLGLIGPTDPNRLSGWTYRFPEYLCAGLALRTAEDRARQLAAMRGSVISTVGLAFADAETNPTALSDIFAQVEFALDLTLGECTLSNPVLNSFSRDAAGEEAALFDNLDYEPLWWLRRPRSEAQLAAFARGEDYPVLSGHSALSQAEVDAALSQGTTADPDLKAAFLARHRLLTDAYQGSFDPLTFGAERRQFRLRSDGGNGSITLAGYLDIRPILSDGKLIVALRPRIESPDYGGLAAMITEPDRAPYEADHRLLMFDAVTLDATGHETPLLHQGTSASGVHFFAAPHAGDLSDQSLHLRLRFVDTLWEIDLPLWASTLAHDLRAAGTTEGKAAP